MDEHTLHTPRRGRRTLLWALFGLAGVIMGTAWATGFANSTTEVDPNNELAQNVFGDPAAIPQSASPYQQYLGSTVGQISIDFDGLWGQIANDELVFQVDLTNVDPDDEGTYYLDIILQNDPGDWNALQLKWLQMPCADVTADSTGAFNTAYDVPAGDGVGEPKVMNITARDSHVSFSGLVSDPDDGAYCFGVAATDDNDLDNDGTPEDTDNHADDIDGTFITRPDGTTAPTAPVFTAILNKSADA